MKQIIALTLLLFMVGSAKQVYSQSWLEKLGNKAVEKAKNKTEDNIEEKVGKGIDDIFEGNKKDKSNKKEKSEQQDDNGNTAVNADTHGQVDKADGKVAKAGGQQQKGQSLEMTYAKSDFVPGDEIIFDDQLVGEQLGEFPSMWDMLEGNIEVLKLNGENAIALSQSAGITPYMKNPKNYLPESYTIEFEFFKGGNRSTEDRENYIAGTYYFIIDDADNNRIVELSTPGYKSNLSDHSFGSELEADIRSTRGDSRYVKENLEYLQGWNRISISFNKRALKVYVNGTRYVNAPNVAQGGWFSIVTEKNGGAETPPTFYIRNVRIAKGAVPLYDRMMSDGKFITYGITFDVGKSTIKPESMSEINRIVQLMTENPTLKFSVEGHTDATGNATSNQTLSEARSKAIVAKLVELGIAADRLTSVGKGQNSPIADNTTDEGRAKNRRVEFVKQ